MVEKDISTLMSPTISLSFQSSLLLRSPYWISSSFSSAEPATSFIISGDLLVGQGYTIYQESHRKC